MELPHLGKHCTEPTCNLLDFLPMQCDACEKIFCKDHFHYDHHKCESSYKKDVQVPVCPLCGKPVPVPRGETPDIKVGEHIDRDCQSDPAKKKRKAYSNRCSAPKCKQHELMPVICNDCRLNYCLRHRHPLDHNCKGFQKTGRSVSSAGAAAVKRVSANGPSTSRQRNNAAKPVAKAPQQTLLHGLGERRERQQSNIRSMQANLSEDEALARALQLSQMESKSDKPMTQEEKDLALARQLQAQEEEERRRRRRGGQGQRNNSSSESSCKKPSLKLKHNKRGSKKTFAHSSIRSFFK
uniref:AN1-type zinc finger protein 2A n=1 Tax=Ciona intestinalis TaxID=7719 RepID=F6R192_CIOIN